MCDWGTMCRGEGCGAGLPTTGCDLTVHCSNCTIGLMPVASLPTQDADGRWQPPAGAILGHIVEGAGWVIDDAGNSDLQPDDLVLTIDGQPANLAYFFLHWFEMQQAKKPTEWLAVVYRPGERFLISLVLKQP